MSAQTQAPNSNPDVSRTTKVRNRSTLSANQAKLLAGVRNIELYNFVVRCTSHTSLTEPFLMMGAHSSVNFYASQTRVVIQGPGARFCAMLSSGGEIGLMGLRSESDYRMAVGLLIDIGSRATGRPVAIHTIRCNNIQGILRMPCELDVGRLARDEKHAIVHYEPTIITPAKVSHKFVDSRGVAHCAVGVAYSTGNVVITGMNTPEAMESAACALAMVLVPYCTTLPNAKYDRPVDHAAKAQSTESNTRAGMNPWTRLHARRFKHSHMTMVDKTSLQGTPVHKNPLLPQPKYSW